MKTPIDFWFDFSSPYAYFAAMTIERLADRLKRDVLWRPFLLGVIYQVSGMSAWTDQPLRSDYARRDWERLAKTLDVPLRSPAPSPYRSQPVARAFYWFEQHRPEHATLFAKLAFQGHFSAGMNLSEGNGVLQIAADLLQDVLPLEEWLRSEAAKEKLRAMTSEALDKGVFGSPFFLADGEPFWGWDRMDLMERWLQTKSWTPGLLRADFTRAV